MSKQENIVISEVPAHYKELQKRFPDGVAQIVPIYEPYDRLQFIEKPTKEQREDINNHRRARTNTIILEMQQARGTHPVSGQPNVKPKEYDIEIFPHEPFTNKIKGLSTDFKNNPWAILDALINHDGYGNSFKLVAPPSEHFQKLMKNANNPEVRKEISKRQAEMRSLTGRQKTLDATSPYGADKKQKRRPLPDIGKPGEAPVDEYGDDEGLEEMDVTTEPTLEELEVE